MRFKSILVYAIILAVLVTSCTGQDMKAGAGLPGKDPSKNSFVKLAEKYRNQYYKMLFGEEKTFVDQQLARLKTKGLKSLEDAVEISSIGGNAGVFGYSENMAIVLTAAAAAIEPDNALIANNFGAILRLLNYTDDSITALAHAKALQQDSPMILCNLANSFLEKDDDNSAEKLYNEALNKDDSFGPAHQGLVLVYLKRRDIPKAIEELIKGSSICFEGTAKRQYEAAKYNGSGEDFEPPLAPLVPPEPLAPLVPPENSPGTVDTPEAQLKIPDFPSWPNSDSFLASQEEIKKWSDDLCGTGMKEVGKALGKLGEIANGTYNSPATAEAPKPLKITNAGKNFAFNLLTDYYSAKANKMNKEYNEKLGELDKKFSDERTQLQESYYPQMVDKDAGMGKELEKYPEKADELVRKIKDVSETHFSQWQSLTKEYYDKFRQLME